MKINRLAVLVLGTVGSVAFSQEADFDEWEKGFEIEEVVITGQFEPQSINKSVHNVRVITSQDIKNLGAVHLGDVLNQYINITVAPSSSGRTTVSMFGLDANYFKILVDNIPLVNEGGLGNNTDLSQINLNDIERIEIIEGAMGVTHGANAVSGILNIITKKSTADKWNISATLQEETIGDEYAFFDQGRHIQTLKLSHNISDNWFVSVGANRNDFKGYLGNMKGRHHQINDGLRGNLWLPREQFQPNAMITYRKSDFRMFYKFEFLNEEINFYENATQSGWNTQYGSYRYGNDQRYFTNRFYHHLNATGKIKSKVNYNISLSHQYQKREIEKFRYNITFDTEMNNTLQKDQSMEVLYSIGTFSNFFDNKKIDFQLGYELVNNNGFSVEDEQGNQTKQVREKIDNYDLFAISEIKANKNLSLRPGLRYSFQSIFDNQYAVSFGARYLLPKGFEVRTSIGKSYRTPNFNELFSKIIFDGHYFVGNEDLKPEQSMTYEVNAKKYTYFESGYSLSNNFMVSYSDIEGRITSALVGWEGATPMYQYINISKYRSVNFSNTNQFRMDNWNFSLGASLTGISRLMDNQEFSSDDRYLYNFNMNVNASYTIPKWNTTLAAYYKYTGKTQLFVEGTNQYTLSDIEPYSWLDASVRKTFWNDKLEATIGARNLFDITNINQTGFNQGIGHSASSQILLAYGRSYFLKLTYNLNF
ncbi:MAG: TonB-dependent receptor plug domain-containing protein [Flavobacteriaceae bacterium]